ncbi:hypothetical protein CEXT_684071 [Caerostris extrusa]|uniref:Uncharacterized protein n=1 Tax=Caerostris extrusa TaxID=172846 RepID=A0AAV4VLK8_CAEEX|nr:hypothetical protein CEXT_684071 [Caerostris extrusa]
MVKRLQLIQSVVYQDACFILPGSLASNLAPAQPPSTTSLAPTISAIIHRSPLPPPTPALFHTLPHPPQYNRFLPGGVVGVVGFCFGRVSSTTGLKVVEGVFCGGCWEGPRWPRAATRMHLVPHALERPSP